MAQDKIFEKVLAMQMSHKLLDRLIPELYAVECSYCCNGLGGR